MTIAPPLPSSRRPTLDDCDLEPDPFSLASWVEFRYHRFCSGAYPIRFCRAMMVVPDRGSPNRWSAASHRSKSALNLTGCAGGSDTPESISALMAAVLCLTGYRSLTARTAATERGKPMYRKQ
jgi:hypothetical protein